MIRTMIADIAADTAGFILAHEHVYSDFAAASDDLDLAFVDIEGIRDDMREASRGGVDILVELSTYDMGADPVRTASLCSEVGLGVVKGTGWFRSPSLDPFVAGRTADSLSERLIADLKEGFEGTPLRAGVIGEVGMRGNKPTRPESTALDAAAAASLATGAGIIAHTDDWENADAIVQQLRNRGVPPTRIMLAHCRCSDPLSAQTDAVQAGMTLAFDQLGHPLRDPVSAVAERIQTLIAEGCLDRLVVSSDVGRLSRLRAAGGSGYVQPVRHLLRELVGRGVHPHDVSELISGGPARFLPWAPQDLPA